MFKPFKTCADRLALSISTLSLSFALLLAATCVVTADPAAPPTPTAPAPTIIRPVTAKATSENSGCEAANAIDGDTTTFWHTQFSPTADPLPQSLTVDFGSVKKFDGLDYLPRQDSNITGNITKYEIDTSKDGVTFTKLATGDWDDDNTLKMDKCPATSARYVKLTALDGYGGFANAAEFYAVVNH